MNCGALLRRLRPVGLIQVLSLPSVAVGQDGGATISGRVRDATDGAPMGFASVVVERTDSGQTQTGTLSAEDGRFVVAGLAPAVYTIWTSFPGFETAQTQVLVGELNQSSGELTVAQV